jgi:Na+/melibiose symporter-like transporter
VLLTVGLVGLLVPLIQGQDASWATWTFLALAVAVVLLVFFAAWEVAYARRGYDPLVPPRLFTHPAFSGGVGLAMVYFAAFTSIFFVLSILWQAGLGHTALETGVMLLPFAVGSMIASALSDRLSRRLGRTVLMLGTLLVTIGLTWTWLILRAANPVELTSWNLLLPLLIAGIGNGAFIAPNTEFIIATVIWSDAGAASGVVATAQRIGSAIGIAVVGNVMFGTLTITGPATVPAAFTDAAAAAMAVSTGLSLAALVLVFVLPRHVTARPSPASTAGSRAVPGR